MSDTPAKPPSSPADPEAEQPEARFPWQGHPNPWHLIGEVIEEMHERITKLEGKASSDETKPAA